MGGATDEPRPGFDHWVSFRGQGNYLSPRPGYTLNVDGKRVELAEWIDAQVSFPNSMVDSIVPATGPDELALALSFGVADAAPVTAARFPQTLNQKIN